MMLMVATNSTTSSQGEGIVGPCLPAQNPRRISRIKGLMSSVRNPASNTHLSIEAVTILGDSDRAHMLLDTVILILTLYICCRRMSLVGISLSVRKKATALDMTFSFEFREESCAICIRRLTAP